MSDCFETLIMTNYRYYANVLWGYGHLIPPGIIKLQHVHRFTVAMLTLACYQTHQTVFFQHENARSFIKRTGSNSPAVAAPSNRMNLRCMSREFSTFVVVFEAFLHLLVVLRRHVDSDVIFQRRERVLTLTAPFWFGVGIRVFLPSNCRSDRYSAFCLGRISASYQFYFDMEGFYLEMPSFSPQCIRKKCASHCHQ